MKSRFYYAAALLMAGAVILSAGGCESKPATQEGTKPSGVSNPTSTANSGQQAADSTSGVVAPQPPAQADPKPDPGKTSAPGAPGSTAKPQPDNGGKDKAIQVVANPADKAVLVNKVNKLPDSYKPQDLVDPNVPFIFQEKSEKRKLRKEAADALEKLFKAAKDDKLPLAGVSAFRSHETQSTIYANYVKKDGVEAADKYSAKPGHSEHETGLAIDVSGISGKCAAADCFAAVPEAKWLDEHAAEYGFIIRYPKGKQAITGYQYEPWHLRYVGTELAKEMTKRGITLEEYAGQATPVSKP